MEGERGVIGIRKENTNRWERRVAVIPEHVAELVAQGIRVLVEPSTLRCYPDREYEKAGAEITEDLSPAQLIIGVKEVPIERLIPNHTYLFFAHVFKAQLYNMPLLDAMLSKNIRMLDYEKICAVEPPNERLVAFGRYAGIVGIQDFMVGLGNFLL
jgi:alpha-aminoadipic semialdehyde synthase